MGVDGDDDDNDNDDDDDDDKVSIESVLAFLACYFFL